MPESVPPTASELLRRLDDVTRRLDNLVTSLEDKYVPRREYELRVGEVEKDVQAQASFRRQVAAGAAVGLILIIVTIVLAAARIPGVGS